MKKLLTSMFLVLALLALTAGFAFAQAATPVKGTVQSVVLETNATTGETIVVVSLLDGTGIPQTVNIDLQTALSLGLVTTDPITGVSTVAADAVGKMVEVTPATTGGDDTNTNQHPVGSALSDFFSSLLGVNYETIMTYHEDGFGFGVIAQALWMTKNIDGDTATFEALLDAKQSGDYSNITLADGSTPNNWGDVVKSLKNGNNLGFVMSGKGQNNQGAPHENVIETPGNGHGNSNNGTSSGTGNGINNGNVGNNGNGNGHGNGNTGGNNGNGHGNGNGGGRP